MERFFWSLKHVWKKFESFDNIAQARLSVLTSTLTLSTTQREFIRPSDTELPTNSKNSTEQNQPSKN